MPPTIHHEEDIARSHDHENVHVYTRKEKGKERHTPSSTSSTSSEHVDEITYPPTSEDIEETRRVEEASLLLIALSPV